METQKPYEFVNGPILLLLHDKVAERLYMLFT